MDIKKDLIRITSEYLEDTLDYEKLLKTSKEYKNVLNTLSNENLDNEKGRNDIHFNNGKALGSVWAALCIDDLVRTRQFIRGIHKAIEGKKAKKEIIHILYAGTGPFATLILPFILRYSKSEIKYTLLEINPLSFNVLQNVISKLGLEEHDIKFVNDDATKYKFDNGTPDIIVSETMQNALDKEQQVSIFYNLMSQGNTDTIFIPENITVSIDLKEKGIAVEKLQRKDYHKQNIIFELSKETMFTSEEIEFQPGKEPKYPKKTTIIEREKLVGFNELVLITEIQVFKDIKIILNESGLTTPKSIKDISENHQGTININSQYVIGTSPKFDLEIL
ncbi:MAG: hypothetical protein COA88_07385 [Kordia sp.]|nr:MAG: hypothetical protein COA88_07385 [Kordia sp.]